MVLKYLDTKKGFKPNTATLFSIAMFFMGAGMLVLYLGVKLTGRFDQISMAWPLFSLFLQSIGELLIAPIAFSMVGELVPVSLQPVCTGLVLYMLGIGSLVAGKLSVYTFNYNSNNQLISFQHTFGDLSVFAVIVGAVLFLNRKRIGRLILPQQNMQDMGVSASNS